ncbi:hypothetical protein M409DRAFT_21239 [Zasmidium cellare ATCC 36951]|uniref:Uncharacterized protein n=1 Tax=Zasmidium cellare ATCC 36951 TaxID=1080233 RepID=A0A6A6CQT2_ZASCE|nr:uncharacterized protein M409DRAFT_21239 [Zasmidium cellare ATCC 36951]KAF2168490.1 hypothetical protein M409DRAFT_21239 [Zasmidium cellare ATCC 36951]
MDDCNTARGAARAILEMKSTTRTIECRDLIDSWMHDFQKSHILIHLVSDPLFEEMGPYTREDIMAHAAKARDMWFASPNQSLYFKMPYGTPYRDGQGDLKFRPFQRTLLDGGALFISCEGLSAIGDTEEQTASATEENAAEEDTAEKDTN